MIPVLDRYELVTPGTLSDVLADLAAHPEARPFAGGTDLMVMLEAGHLPAGRYVSLANCRELMGIERSDTGGVTIGALTTYTEIRNSTLIDEGYGLLKRAAAETGSVATQNRGTIGGNIANASPAADTPPVLLVYDAELELLSSAGARRVPYTAFHRGYKQMDLRPGEIIARVMLPPRASHLPSRDYYRKVGTRRAQAISKVCFAASISFGDDATEHREGASGAERAAKRRASDAVGESEGRRPSEIKDIRIALGSVAPTVIRATRTESALRGRALDQAAIAEAQQILASEIAPIDDIRSNARYRSRVAINLLAEFLLDQG